MAFGEDMEGIPDLKPSASQYIRLLARVELPCRRYQSLPMKHRDLLVLIANDREKRPPQTDAFTSAEVADHIWSCLLEDAMAYAQYRCWKAILSPHEPLSKEHIEKLAEKATPGIPSSD